MNRSHEASGLAKVVGGETTVCWDEGRRSRIVKIAGLSRGGMAQESVGLGVGR